MHPPSNDQQEWLNRMIEVLVDHAPARALAEKLWRFYEFRLKCTVLPDDGRPSSCEINQAAFAETRQAADAAPKIWVRKTHRTAEAMVHELLHLDLLADGFPRIRAVPPPNDDKSRLAAAVQNLADHVVMLPRYLALGYDKDRFTGPANLTPAEIQLAKEIEALPDLLTPIGYKTAVLDYLNGKGDFQLISVEPKK